jgi:hypothetical protein
MSEMWYQITIAGHLDAKWAGWFGEMAISRNRRGGQPVTTLSGPVADQAALHGILARIRDLNLTLVALTRLERDLPQKA